MIVNTANFWYTREELGVTEDSWDWLKRANEDKWDSLERAHRAGVKIAAGSNAGFLVDHGQNAAERAELVKGGLAPIEAIQAATKTAAELLRVDRETGTLAPGKLADVVVVDSDPLTSIALLQWHERITYVFRSGRLVNAPTASEITAGRQDVRLRA
ncbi:MAG TPA: amidohydrolase family protein [Thermomicrobiaceae bacterium]|nr:amidohydrolase family protein [Thermomicrobiaceae bacterium]